jgi:hypothetical protein
LYFDIGTRTKTAMDIPTMAPELKEIKYFQKEGAEYKGKAEWLGSREVERQGRSGRRAGASRGTTTKMAIDSPTTALMLKNFVFLETGRRSGSEKELDWEKEAEKEHGRVGEGVKKR